MTDVSARLSRSNFLRFLPLIAVLVTVGLYYPSIFGEFVWDDQTYFVENDILTSYDVTDIKEVFLSRSNYWGEHYPLRDYLYVLEYNAFGEDPRGYHVVSLLLFILSAFVLFRWSRYVFSHPELGPVSANKNGASATISALVVYCLFLVNPVYVESVAYISGQKDVLSLLFILLSLHFLSPVGDASGRRWILLFATGTLFHYCAVFSKYSALATIVFIPFFWMATSKRILCQRMVRNVGVWLLVNIPVVWWVFSPRIASMAGEALGTGTPWADRITRAVEFLGFYLPHTLWPWPLSFGYGSQGQVSFDPYFGVGLAIVAGLAVFMLVRRRALVTLGLVIFVAYLLPVLQIYPDLANAKVFDRYLAVPAIGVLILIAVASERITRGWRSRQRTLAAALLVLCVAWGFMTSKYIPTFGSPLAAAEHHYRLYPESPTAFLNLADMMIDLGRLDEAERFVRENDRFEQPDWLGDFLLGLIYLEREDLDKAYGHLYSAGMKTYRGGYFPVADVFLAEVIFKQGNPAMARRILENLLSQKRKDPLVTMKAKKLLEEIESRESKGD